MEIEWLDPRPLDAPGGVFGFEKKASHMGVGRSEFENLGTYDPLAPR
jgi:hypothetical protein